MSIIGLLANQTIALNGLITPVSVWLLLDRLAGLTLAIQAVSVTLIEKSRGFCTFILYRYILSGTDNILVTLNIVNSVIAPGIL